MILKNTKNSNLIKSGGIETTSVNIETSPTAVKVLTENLYSNIPLAIVRELCTNAMDANHRANQPPNNFSIHFPTVSESYFSVEDHGIGMTKEEVLYVYTTFFKSTKSGDNDNTGMFGLGSKTPLAYTKSFSVVSNCNGVSNAFVETWEDNKMPEISLMASTKTEKTGTKVTVPVKLEDFEDFYRSIIKVCLFTPGLPNFENNVDIAGVLNPYRYVNHNVMLSSLLDKLKNLNADFNNTYVTYDELPYNKLCPDKIYLEMGNIGYPIAIPCVFDEKSEMGMLFLDLSTRNIPSSLFIIHANIGDVDVPPNREVLQWSKKTCAYIKSWLLTFIVKQYKNLDDINERFKFYANCTDIKYLDLVYRNKSSIFSDKLGDFLNFYTKYKDDLQTISQVFIHNPVLTFAPSVEIDYKNRLVPYPYIDNLDTNYFNFSSKPLYVINMKDLPRKLSKSSTGNIMGTYIRSHIRACDNYKNYNFLFANTETIKMLDKHGIEYKLLDDFNKNLVSVKDTWSSSKIFEISWKPKDSLRTTTECCLESWNTARNIIDSHDLKILPLVRNAKGYSLLYDKNLQKTLGPIGKHFGFIQEKILAELDDGIIISGNAKDITKLISMASEYEMIDYVDVVKSRMIQFIEDAEKLPVPERNNFFERLNKMNLMGYAKSYNWPDGSGFKTAMELNNVSSDDRLNDKVSWLIFGQGQFDYSVFKMLPITGLEEYANRLKHILDHTYKNDISRLFDKYPLIHTGSINFFSKERGITNEGVMVEEVKALIDYFAIFDGAKRIGSTN